MNLRLLLTTALLGFTLGCTSPPPSSPTPVATTRDVGAEAMAAIDRAEWARAAELLREALRQEPSSVKFHYHLALAGTHLNLRDEAIREFQWVLAHVAPELPEAQEARRWLTDAGVLPRSGSETASTTPSEGITQETPGDSVVSGRVVWADGKPTARLQIFLKGAPKTPVQTLQWVRRTDDSGYFEFKRIPPGTYMLTNRIAGEPLWRLRVQLEPGQTLTLDLSEANNAKIRDDFPES
jgi:Carboxypeptidase regulatory-like domain